MSMVTNRLSDQRLFTPIWSQEAPYCWFIVHWVMNSVVYTWYEACLSMCTHTHTHTGERFHLHNVNFPGVNCEKQPCFVLPVQSTARRGSFLNSSDAQMIYPKHSIKEVISSNMPKNNIFDIFWFHASMHFILKISSTWSTEEWSMYQSALLLILLDSL